jgi:hypothetical protein
MVTYFYLMGCVMLTEQQMDDIKERVIKAESRLDRHGEALTRLELAGSQSEHKIAALADQIQTFVTQARTALWIVGIIVVASQSGFLAALKAIIGI